MSTIFRLPILVKEDDIDQFKHVNNEVYITWLMCAATAHSESLGYSLQKYLDDGAAFVVRRHEIDYLAPVLLGEQLTLETWVPEMLGLKTTREYRMIRSRDQKVVLNAKTLWVYVNLKTGRPQAIPQELLDVFASI